MPLGKFTALEKRSTIPKFFERQKAKFLGVR